MSRCRIVIQSRTSSTRLPAKALLPIAGIPSSALCAIRAANAGGDVVVATSDDASDDLLVTTLSAYGVKSRRGPLSDVLERFVLAVEDLSDDDVVVRLTADNVFPDGGFVETLVQHFCSMNTEYLGTHSPFDGLPYGLSAEVFTVGILRQAAQHAVSSVEREHVTPWIRRHARSALADHRMMGLSRRYDHLRCTLDTLEDYYRLANLFGGCKQSVETIAWEKLVEMLNDSPSAPQFRIPYRMREGGCLSGIVSLGTVQIGTPYGIANSLGMPDDADVTEIFRVAIAHGVTDIDTARAYGVSERRIGRLGGAELRSRARIITKLDPLTRLGIDATRAEVLAAVDASVFQSCRELAVTTLDMLALHRWEHRFQFDGVIWERLQQLQQDGVIGQLGVSLSTPEEAIAALRDSSIKHIQLPCNVLDGRWEQEEFLALRGRRSDVSIHARSAFLQGILLSPAAIWPQGIIDAVAMVDKLNMAVKELGRKNKADLCIAYLAGLDWIDSIVIGVESVSQFLENLQLARYQPLSVDERTYLKKTLGVVPVRLLNPAMWMT